MAKTPPEVLQHRKQKRKMLRELGEYTKGIDGLKIALSKMESLARTTRVKIVIFELEREFNEYDLIFRGWDCPNSPFGTCVYDKSNNPFNCDEEHLECLFCSIEEAMQCPK